MIVGSDRSLSVLSSTDRAGLAVLQLSLPCGRSGSVRRSSLSAALRQWHELERAVHALREPKHIEVPTSRGEKP